MMNLDLFYVNSSARSRFAHALDSAFAPPYNYNGYIYYKFFSRIDGEPGVQLALVSPVLPVIKELLRNGDQDVLGKPVPSCPGQSWCQTMTIDS